MSELTIELCPETGICSLVKPGSKTDLTPNEVAEIKAAGNDANAVRQAIAEVDPAFADDLLNDEVKKIVERMKK